MEQPSIGLLEQKPGAEELVENCALLSVAGVPLLVLVARRR
jgi:hypothetical protein